MRTGDFFHNPHSPNPFASCFSELILRSSCDIDRILKVALVVSYPKKAANIATYQFFSELSGKE